MVRGVIAAVAAVGLGACGAGPVSVPLGFGNGGIEATTSALPLRSEAGVSQDAPAAARSVKTAKLDDMAPAGSFEHAPKGALSDRDYSQTGLDPERARALVNAYRRSKGLAPLRLNAQLTEAAKAHSRDLAKWDRISHFGSDGSNPWDRVNRTGYKATVTAENVGTGQATFEEVLKGWEASPGHNKNLLLADARHMGIALVQDPRTEFKAFWTLVIAAGK